MFFQGISLSAMKVFNTMFSKKLGGLEQAFLDYNHALLMQHNELLPVIHPHAMVKKKVGSHSVAINNFNSYDFIAVMKLRKLIDAEQPNCIITHGKRATLLFKKATTNTAIIAVSHKHNYEYLKSVDAVITVTEHMRNELVAAGFDAGRVYYVPNMINIPDNITYTAPNFHDIPVIGMIGRMTPEKGHDVFVKALAELKKNRVKFRAKIAGDGDEKPALIELIKALDLETEVELLRWVDDNNAFYKSVDMVCVPSRFESFGIVLLESFLYSKPCIASSCDGPREIGKHEENLLLFPIDDHVALANSIKRLLDDKKLTAKITKNGFLRVQNYSYFNVSRMLQRVIEEVCFKRNSHLS